MFFNRVNPDIRLIAFQYHRDDIGNKVVKLRQ